LSGWVAKEFFGQKSLNAAFAVGVVPVCDIWKPHSLFENVWLLWWMLDCFSRQVFLWILCRFLHRHYFKHFLCRSFLWPWV
jgi:hypothetical protein